MPTLGYRRLAFWESADGPSSRGDIVRPMGRPAATDDVGERDRPESPVRVRVHRGIVVVG
jgi:hypothetical protein